MGASNKPYRELLAVLDLHEFKLIDTTRDGRERWRGLRWSEDHPLIVKRTIDAHASVNVIRQITKAAGLETVDRAKKRDPQAIKQRRQAERDRAREAELAREKQRQELLETRASETAEGVSAVLSRHTAEQLAEQQRIEALSQQDVRRVEERERELARLDRIMRQRPREGR